MVTATRQLLVKRGDDVLDICAAPDVLWNGDDDDDTRRANSHARAPSLSGGELLSVYMLYRCMDCPSWQYYTI